MNKIFIIFRLIIPIPFPLLQLLELGSDLNKMAGPKKFVEWKGSVLDSVVGVFLTQNVCDVLSR